MASGIFEKLKIQIANPHIVNDVIVVITISSMKFFIDGGLNKNLITAKLKIKAKILPDVKNTNPCHTKRQ